MLPEPLRIADFSAHTTALRLPEIGPPLGPVGSLFGATIRLRGERAGNLYLSDKQGGAEFTSEDEETLVMFASQAAMAIANARRHHDERHSKADLETLIDTSPVGVVVFNAVTGVLVSFNREARRIVDVLREPEQSPERLLNALTFRRADGREISLAEFPPGAGAQRGGDGARRGDRHRGPRRSEGHRPAQRNSHPLRRGRGRVGGRHPAGHDAPGGAGPASD